MPTAPRGTRAKESKPLAGANAEVPNKRRCSPSWARLISKENHADPLTCRQCGGRLQVVAYINDQFTIKKILERAKRSSRSACTGSCGPGVGERQRAFMPMIRAALSW
jgi:hypothetical protein